jgi:membrane-bound lytic murein transglycosylase MltF
MNTPRTPDSVFHEIAQIQRMDRGTLSILRQGPSGPYYNHQCYENGRNVSRYVPADQVAVLREDLQSFRRFEQLVAEYSQLLVEQTRAQRQAGTKKKPAPNSSWPKTRKSNRS